MTMHGLEWKAQRCHSTKRELTENSLRGNSEGINLDVEVRCLDEAFDGHLTIQIAVFVHLFFWVVSPSIANAQGIKDKFLFNATHIYSRTSHLLVISISFFFFKYIFYCKDNILIKNYNWPFYEFFNIYY